MNNPNIFFASSLSLDVTCFILIILIARFKQTYAQNMWLLFNIALFVWGIGATLVSANSTNPTLAITCWRFSCVAVTFISILYLHFIILLIEKQKNQFLPLLYLIVIVFAYFVSMTNYVISPLSFLFQNNFFVPSMGPLYALWFFFWFAICARAHFLTVLHISHSKNPQLWYVFIPSVIASFLGLLNFLAPFRFSIFQYGNFGIALYCLLTSFFIFRNQIVGIEIVVRRGLIYSILISLLSGCYLLLVFFAEWSFRGILGYNSLIVTLSAALIISFFFNPLRSYIQTLIDRIFFGKTPEEIARENERLKEEIERAERLKTASTLALGLAHEIKNPLTTIKAKFASLIPAEIERINSFVHRLLDFSKPTPPRLQETNIHGLIRDILDFLSNDFLKQHIRIRESYENVELTLPLDPSQIKQVILNLLLNALEAMPQGGTITINTQKTPEGTFQLSIQDEGCGISPEHMKKLFSPFFSTKESGSGLGLSICHQIVKNHGGTIKVESTKGKGTNFRINFGAVRKEAEAR